MNLSQIYEGWRNKLVPPSAIKGPIDKWLPVLTEEQEEEIKSDGGEQQEEGSDS